MAVHIYGRLLFLVDSHTRSAMKHLVDLEPQEPDRHGHIEPYACSCESFNLRLDRPCRHCIEAFEFVLPIVQHLKHWQPVGHQQPKPEKTKRTYNLNRNKPRHYEPKHR